MIFSEGTVPVRLYAIFGTGAFGRECIWLAEEMLRTLAEDADDFMLCFVDDTPSAARIEGYNVYTWEEFVAIDSAKKYFNVLIADPAVRKSVVERCLAIGLTPFTIRSRLAEVHPTAVIGEGAVICQFALISANAKVGRFFHLNHHSYVSHDCVVGDYVTFAPAVRCNGTIQIKDLAYLGAGSIIHQGTPERTMTVGRQAIVGMGAVVLRPIPDGVTVVGNPARPLL
jgi:sugar O-acyltransferase (sialic acid O-acetyltransferase NeuD family)